MRIGSLFSGAGGLDMAVEEVFGGEVVWQCEFNDAASKVLAHRYPGVPNFGDVTAIDWDTVEPVDVMCGGYPCQPFSPAGQRKGTDDERHLWPYFAEAIRRVRPRYVVLENVAGHRSMGFDCVLGDLASMWYDAQWCSVRASDVGATHRRERLFVLGVDADADNATVNGERPRAEPRQGNRDAADAAGECRADIAGRGSEAGQHVLTVSGASDRDRQRGVAAGVHQLGGAAAELAAVDLLPTPRKSDGDGGANPLSRAERMDDVETRVIRIGTCPACPHHRHFGSECPQCYCVCSPDRGDYPDLGQWGKYEPAIRRWEDLTRPAPAPTEPNTRGNPRLAAAFPEWMMGWPAGWVTELVALGLISRNDALRIIGNGVVPQQAIAALRWLLQIQAVAA